MQPSRRQYADPHLELAEGTIWCGGPWTVRHLHRIAPVIKDLQPPGDSIRIDLQGIASMDTGGAWLLSRLIANLRRQGCRIDVINPSRELQGMLSLVTETAARLTSPPPADRPGLVEMLGRISRESGRNGVGMLSFVGEMAGIAVARLVMPSRFRWRAMVHELGEAGYKAVAIVGLLAFLLGIVITYQGGVQLRQYGASLFVADLVGLSMLRELAPMLTAIIVAGRTGSAYTAQIGTMKVTEEIDALRAMGIQPMELLVLPKLIALIIALPLLTVYADIMGVIGGMVMASAQLDIAYGTFLERLQIALSVDSFLVGVGKAPVFAGVIATIGCYQGFQVSGSAESVGRRTTTSVVQSILAVIVIDAAFSVAFSYLGI